MSIVDDLVSNLVERNTITLNGTFTITLSMAECRSRDRSFRPFAIRRRTRTCSTSRLPSPRM